MPDFFSSVLTGQRATPPALPNRTLQQGHVQAATFDLAPGANIAVGDRLFLCRLPKGARVVGGVFEVTNVFGAASTNGRIRTETTNDVFAGPNQFNLAAVGQWVIDRVARGLDYVGKSRDNVEGYELVFVDVQAVTSPVTTGRIRGVILYVT
jgi:hypothetical protein